MITKSEFYRQQNIIDFRGVIDTESVAELIAELYYFQNKMEKEYVPVSDQLITVRLNTPGGSVCDGFEVIDVFNEIPSKIRTIGAGLVASMGAVILSAGTPGFREAYENTEILIHQPMGGVSGQATEIINAARHIARNREILYNFLAKNTGQPLDQIAKDCERDTVFSGEQALRYGLIDRIRSKGDTLWKN